MGLGGFLGVIATGFLIGGAARWIVPGPDPMPLWLTIWIGMIGSLAGSGIAALAFGSSHLTTTRAHIFATLLLEVAVAVAVVLVYRRFVQRRSLTGPDARTFPTRGIGIARMRERLRQVGIDPEQFRGRHGVFAQPRTAPPEPQPAAEEPSASESPDELEELRDLHEKGILTDEEFEAARKRLFS